MVTQMNRTVKSFVLCSIALGLAGTRVSAIPAPALAAPSLNAYVAQPFVQGPDVSGVQIETFDSGCPATWWLGSGNPATRAGGCRGTFGNVWGGASTTSGAPSRGGGLPQTSYGAVFNGRQLTVTLDHAASYLGFQWSAGDVKNTLALYSGDSVVGTFTTHDLLSMLYNDDMGAWSANDYLINPARDQWIGQPFAYIYLVGADGLTFDSFVISQNGDGPVGDFEFDNFSLSDTPVNLDPTTALLVGDEPVPDSNENGIDDTTEDSDRDGIADPFEDHNRNGVADVFDDSDGDGTNDYVERIGLAETGFDLRAGVMGVLAGIGVAAFGVMIRRRRTQS